MLVMRLQRVGRRNDPAFRIAVTEKRSKPKSGGVEIVGSYHPKTKATVLQNERIVYWLSKGAHASPTVHNLLVAKGVIQGAKVARSKIIKGVKGEGKVEEKEAPPVVKEAAPAEEAVAAETPIPHETPA